MQEELAEFHSEYDRLLREEADFRNSFKIVMVHHHPLPVNWQTDWKQQLLTMVNAGSFLSAMLNRKVDLVLHGHEHLQARARLKSTLGGQNNAELVVVSLGATLKQVDNPARNWFNLITVETGKQVTLVSYPANEALFEADGETYVVRSADQAKARTFEDWTQREGYCYDEVASIALLQVDGDCHRTVECEGLEILDELSPRAQGHPIQVPPTSGYIQLLGVEAGQPSSHQGLYIEEPPSQAQPQVQPQSMTANIRYGNSLTLAKGDKVSYRYHWWAVNSFAMDELQFRRKYVQDAGMMEFTHYSVVDPIRELIVLVQFPSDLAPGIRPQIRVTKADAAKADNRGWQRRGDLQKDLERKHALRYLESRSGLLPCE